VLKVMDFGVPRLAERSTSVTEAGLVIGTPAYVPSEQLMAEKVDVRSDLYAAGVVMYECLIGQPPFEASSVISLVAKLLSPPLGQSAVPGADQAAGVKGPRASGVSWW